MSEAEDKAKAALARERQQQDLIRKKEMKEERDVSTKDPYHQNEDWAML